MELCDLRGDQSVLLDNKHIIAWLKKSEWAEECIYSCETSMIIVILQTSRKAKVHIKQEMWIMMVSGDILAAK